MCSEQPRNQLSQEEQNAAEESLSAYCKPVELYNILQRRAIKNPLFLQRCLRYKSQAENKGSIRTGNVIFIYKYFNGRLQKTEATEDYKCPFCLMGCASYKGLRFHLMSSHDLFSFEFRVHGDHQVVSVSVKTNVYSSEIAHNGVAPQRQTFLFCHKPLRCCKRKRLTQNTNPAPPLLLASNVPEGANCDTNSPNTTCVPSAMLRVAKRRRSSVEQPNRRNQELLQKRQFFHSRTAQPMALEQVFAEQDSEDEVDDEVADLEDRRMLDDFVDIDNEEKQIMHLWNSFVRKQRVVADGHTPWSCEAFTRLNGQNFVQNPALLRGWRQFMVKLWNHGLLDTGTMNNCNVILNNYQSQRSMGMKSGNMSYRSLSPLISVSVTMNVDETARSGLGSSPRTFSVGCFETYPGAKKRKQPSNKTPLWESFIRCQITVLILTSR